MVYAISGDQWDNGSQLRLGRVPQDQILDRTAWELANLQADGSVRWVNNLAESQPVLTLEGHLSLPEIVYLSSIGRYLLLTWALHKDFDVTEGSVLPAHPAQMVRSTESLRLDSTLRQLAQPRALLQTPCAALPPGNPLGGSLI